MNGKPHAQWRESKWFSFWNELEADQVVRWKQHPNATYTVDTGEPLREPPDAHFRRAMVFRAEWNHVPWITLRRSSGKIFYALITEVRPHDWTP